MLASLVQFKYVQTISEPNDVNFVVGLAGGYEVFGTPEQYELFVETLPIRQTHLIDCNDYCFGLI